MIHKFLTTSLFKNKSTDKKLSNSAIQYEQQN